MSVISRANRSISITSAAILLAATYFSSNLLGLFYRRLLAARFKLGGELDTYFAAFSIPDLLFYALVAGALTVTLLPVLNERLQSYNKKSAWEIISSMLNLLSVLTLVASVLILLFADPLMHVVAPGFDQEHHDLAVNLTRLLALNPFFFALSSVFGAVQQAYGRFFFFALAPLLYNIGIIFGILFLSPHFGIYGVAYGTVLGALVQMLVQALGLIGTGYAYEFKIFWRNQGFRKILRLIPPRSLDEGIDNLSAVIERAIASTLAVGSIAAYQYAFDLKNVPITLIGTAIATAVFPKMAERAAGTRPDLLKREFVTVMQVMLWLAIPAAVIAVLTRGYLARFLTGQGAPVVASILAWFAVAIVFQSLLRLVARVFYAQQNTKKPFYISVVALILNIILALWFVREHGIVGLAMAQSVVSVVEVVILLIMLRHEMGPLTERTHMMAFAKIMLANAVLVLVTYPLVRYVFPLLSNDVGFFVLVPKFSAIIVLAGVSYLYIGTLLRLREAQIVVRKLSNFAFRRVTIR